jgi:thymidylate kinase
MIIELFGPPGAGKTTFAHALAAYLREHGRVVELILSYRPAEPSSAVGAGIADPMQHQAAAVVRRVTRPAVEMLTMVRHPVANSRDVRTAADLIRLLSPKSLIWSMRMRQYIIRLSHAWQRASQASHIVLFDQGFVQAVCSLALLGRTPDDALIARALGCVPKSDFLIRIDAPRGTLESRLRDRERHQSAIERLFELDLETNLDSMRIVDHLDDLLWRQGRSAIAATSLDWHSLRESLERIEQRIDPALCTSRGVTVAEQRSRPQPRQFLKQQDGLRR